MQYHGVGRHHDQWPHAPTCGCENGTMTGQRYIDEVLLFMFVFSVVLSVINLFLWTTTQHVEHSLFRDCLDREGIQRLVGPARSPDLNPIEKCVRCFGEQLLSSTKLSSNQLHEEHPLSDYPLQEEWDKLPQQLLR
ncbi:hypothetical protein TNCV_1797441 [Trichonephila clavipes]|nr:hypothetical protein TNCV_1797441 [Trichonephila clavipes]